MSVTELLPRQKIRRPPELPGGLPFIGHALEFHRNPVRFLQRGRREWGEIFSFVLAGNRVVFLSGPRANEAFFRASEDQLDAKAAYRFTVPIFGKDVAYDATPQRMDEQLDPGPEVTGNGYEAGEAARGVMPADWRSAIEAAKASGFLRQALGEDLHRTFTAIKESEYLRVARTVNELDYHLYLHEV